MAIDGERWRMVTQMQTFVVVVDFVEQNLSDSNSKPAMSRMLRSKF